MHPSRLREGELPSIPLAELVQSTNLLAFKVFTRAEHLRSVQCSDNICFVFFFFKTVSNLFLLVAIN
jgi:penicillin-binding protein-related factor A (putative recombinase)